MGETMIEPLLVTNPRSHDVQAVAISANPELFYRITHDVLVSPETQAIRANENNGSITTEEVQPMNLVGSPRVFVLARCSWRDPK